MRNIYLTNISAQQALDKFINSLNIKPISEKIHINDSVGRITYSAIYAKYNSPSYDGAAMDGIAVEYEKTSGAREVSPIRLLPNQDFIYVNTGNPIKPPYNAVIMIEDVQKQDDESVLIYKSAAAYQHFRPIGEDIVRSEMILPSWHKIRPVDIGALLSSGISEIEVVKKPRVALIPTGSELISLDSANDISNNQALDGKVIESNTAMLGFLAQELNAVVTRLEIVYDDYLPILEAVKLACQDYDMVLLGSGTSAGSEDYSKKVLEELGEVIVHGVAIKPGKPVILAVVNNKPVVGIPGYPVSAYIAFQNFVAPIIQKLSANKDRGVKNIQAVLTRRLVSSVKYKEYVRVKLGKIKDKYVATPLSRGAGSNMSLVRADGFCIINQEEEGLEAGSVVDIQLIGEPNNLENTVVCIGSHDVALDMITDLLNNEKYNNASLSSSHVGTMGGLMALKNRECHIASVHYLDEASGEYNISIIKKLFEGEDMVLIKGIKRIQGIMVQKGNKFNIRSLSDIANGKHRFINRGRGTGTRMFLDYMLKRENILSSNIVGYDRESATHLTVAGIVSSGSADCGLGTMSAAIACGLDFIPLGEEDYDFAIYKDDVNLTHIQSFIECIKSSEFTNKLKEFGGYGTDNCGSIIHL